MFVITNTGGGVLTGNVAESCEDFVIILGAGPHSLTAGQSDSVTVRFQPTTIGPKACVITTGSVACGNVNLTGVGRTPAGTEFTTWGRIKSLFKD
jgi:hypothetical protein